jgi:hypothetical protein
MSAVIQFKQPQQQTIVQTICLDIETCHAEDSVIAMELSTWKPPANYKTTEAITKARMEAEIRIREKSALLDAAPVACIGLCDLQGDVVVFHWLGVPHGSTGELFSNKSDSERDMLISFREWANACTDINTEIVGFNLGFDLPHLRLAYTRHNLRLPALLIPRAGNVIHDVMFLFTRYFSSKDTPFISLSAVATRLGLSEGKQLSGADVPDYIATGDHQKHHDVVIYNGLDVLLTMRAYLILTGQVGD